MPVALVFQIIGAAISAAGVVVPEADRVIAREEQKKQIEEILEAQREQARRAEVSARCDPHEVQRFVEEYLQKRAHHRAH
jgi:DNA-directed RNA polymerase subunit F